MEEDGCGAVGEGFECRLGAGGVSQALRAEAARLLRTGPAEAAIDPPCIARETAAIAEVAIFKVLVEGERTIRGRVPVWADGNMIDPAAAILLPEHVARKMNAVCIAERGETLIMGIVPPVTPEIMQSLRYVTGKSIEVIKISPEALQDAHAAKLFGTAE